MAGISRAFREKDLERVVELCRAVFGAKKADKFRRNWHWYFNENPALKSYTSSKPSYNSSKSSNSSNRPSSHVFEDNGRIVGYISVVPGIVRIKNKNTGFVWGGDLMSHPGQRGKGIGKEMVRRWKEEANICLALGVGDAAYSIESRMGWFNVDTAKAMIKIISSKKFIAKILKTGKLDFLSPASDILLEIFFRAKKPGDEKCYSISEIKYFDSRFDRFWNRVSKSLGIAVVRNSEYLNWKYTKNPSQSFRIFTISEKKNNVLKGYVVLGKIKSDNLVWGRVVDFVIDPQEKDAMQAFISHLVRHFKKENCDGIQVYGMKKGHRSMFRKNGFFYFKPMGQRFIVKIDKPDKLPCNLGYLRNPDNWFITAGDSDFTA